MESWEEREAGDKRRGKGFADPKRRVFLRGEEKNPPSCSCFRAGTSSVKSCEFLPVILIGCSAKASRISFHVFIFFFFFSPRDLS